MNRYYIAGEKVSEKIDALLDDEAKVVRNARKIARQYGARDVYWQHGFGSRSFSGLAFDTEPDRAIFVRLKNTRDGWRFRVCKATAEIRELTKGMTIASTGDVGEIVGLKQGGLRPSSSGRGMIIGGQAGCEKVGDKYIIEVHPDDGAPKGCKRISDVERERLLDRAKKRRKAS